MRHCNLVAKNYPLLTFYTKFGGSGTSTFSEIKVKSKVPISHVTFHMENSIVFKILIFFLVFPPKWYHKYVTRFEIDT